MKLKFKLMAAAVALAASAGANAAEIVNSQGGNGGLFFTVYDIGADDASTADDRAYVLNLGSLLNGGAISNWGGTITNPSVPLAADKQGFGTIYSVGADANMQSFLAASTDTSRLRWNIGAFDVSGTDRALITAPSIASPGQYTGFRTLGGTADVYLAAINPFLTTSDSAVLLGADANISKWGDTIAGRTTTTPMDFTTTAGLGESLNFYMLSEKFATSNTTVAVTQQQYMADANTAMQWTLANDGNLSYGAVAAIPEPSEYALMLAGLGMLGFMARRRLNNRA
ncbi:MAG: PEP-CTERM sorting domain-containing protein [Rugosibacter sp.]|nr:PEP-CTERM sorting domain-containing protein [Rugosibacter sp.]